MQRKNLQILINSITRNLRRRFIVFSNLTGISKDTIKQFYHGKQKLNNEQIGKIHEAFPKYVYWLATGKTIPEAGQISPETEDVADSYVETGTDTQ
ncbi:hypothetical protein [Aliamphritea ceti]|uniref:hypothetical protein n=1 Tax=Aliamphritea ceti TaxID=1524258 RepID=UPI0021C3AF3E|nr:hypothetical protein [Aliamphritea ceti]